MRPDPIHAGQKGQARRKVSGRGAVLPAPAPAAKKQQFYLIGGEPREGRRTDFSNVCMRGPLGDSLNERCAARLPLAG